MDKLASYTIATRFPVKVLHNECMRDGRILPVHLRLFPTNRCNSACPYCEYGKIDRHQELSLEEIKDIIMHFWFYGTRAISITGGGEPTLHPKFSEIVEYALAREVKVGVETNGILIASGEVKPPAGVSWYRFSLTDPSSGKYPVERIRQFAERVGDTHWGVSCAIPGLIDIETLKAACMAVNDIPSCRYIRFNQEFEHPCHDAMRYVIETLTPLCSKAIFSWRETCPAGAPICRAGLLRPVVAADSFMYPCTNVQLFRDNPTWESLRLGNWRDYPAIKPFDGTACKRCFYAGVNEVLDWLMNVPDDKEFI